MTCSSGIIPVRPSHLYLAVHCSPSCTTSFKEVSHTLGIVVTGTDETFRFGLSTGKFAWNIGKIIWNCESETFEFELSTGNDGKIGVSWETETFEFELSTGNDGTIGVYSGTETFIDGNGEIPNGLKGKGWNGKITGFVIPFKFIIPNGFGNNTFGKRFILCAGVIGFKFTFVNGNPSTESTVESDSG